MTNINGKYRHYKGNFYEVIGVTMHSETKEKLVLYRALYDCPELHEEYGTDPLFVRPYDMFFEKVVIDGVEMPRFELVQP
ncbi:DUF1653 domain-containing protein [Taibaiella soli]|uniref:DUF1653 domain-containing protein n=1 Tax=Taibaiella soli TaxID=1649169 RepID=A0A2W2B0U2_9BACT|nr:DUF1653 domain-containing protein [Taibaiella soli]PZF73618.1 DUF1653 domain-containing protein [Taibaiella soli]